MLTLIAATRNRAKLEEFRRLAGGLAVIESLPGDISPEIETETGKEVDAIAMAKAVVCSRRVQQGTFVIASDGGLSIPALGDAWTATRTRRFAGEAATDLERATRLLDITAHLLGEDRRIAWREALAIARNGRVEAGWIVSGVQGLLAEEVDPAHVVAGNGFWISALWRCPEFDGRLLAELSDAERASRKDHWARLKPPVRSWLKSKTRIIRL